ncbi:MAG: hypothetical protein CMI52_04720 [Parcubacteria group bacterium]|nr:hypothetical protein [Parcubacteria group bacterium]|tara:strand:- start:2375 stop:2755 length:381 start_codon:yes stop_codon:yes gene_type:complete
MATHTKTFIKKMNEQLLEEEARLRSELGQIADPQAEGGSEYATRFPQYGDSEEDNAAEVEDFSHNIAMKGTLTKELADVQKTLKRLGTGDYGICKYCEQPIEEKRLEARPTSNSCVACKKALKQEI